MNFALPCGARWLLVSAAAMLVCGGCVSTRTISVSPASPVRPMFEKGIPALGSQKTNFVCVWLLSSEFTKDTGGLPAFQIGVVNGGDATFDFSTANVTAMSGSTPVPVLTYEQIAKRIKKDANRLAMATAMAGASQSIAASAPQTTYSSGTYGTRGAYGKPATYGTYSGVSTTYNPAATAAAQAQINANTSSQMSAITANRDALLSGMGDILRLNTVRPGASAGGIIKLDASRIEPGPLKLIATVNGEVHEFIFEVGK
jgi:hypothetical protein